MDLVNELYRLSDIFEPRLLMKAGMVVVIISILGIVRHLLSELIARNLDS